MSSVPKPDPRSRRRLMHSGLGWVTAGWIGAHPSPSWSAGAEQVLPTAHSLRDELAQALARHSPLVVLVSLDGCPHCRMVRQNHLLPLWREGLPVVQVNIHSELTLIDVQGQRSTHDAMRRRWGVKVAPTLLFLGPEGRELAERLVGSYLPDFYRGYLEQRLKQARVK